jgi:hypothetical protein
VVQPGGREAEGFEEAEEQLVDHASHGDQHAARHATADPSASDEDDRAAAAGEADYERSSEREDESTP